MLSSISRKFLTGINASRHDVWTKYLSSSLRTVAPEVNKTASHKVNIEANIANLVTQIEAENRVNYRLITTTLSNIDLVDNRLPEEEIIFLLKCCGKYIPNESHQTRDSLCQKLFAQLIDARRVSTNIYHSYISVCTENGVLLNHIDVLQSMNKCYDKCLPNSDTYKLLLSNACENGDARQAVEILNCMKDVQIPLDENDFNNLVQANAMKGGIKGAEVIRHAMKSALISESHNTKFAIVKGLSKAGRVDELREAIRSFDAESLGVDNFLVLLREVGKLGNKELTLEVLNMLPTSHFQSKEDILKVDYLCMNLIHSSQPESAFLIYSHLVEPNPNRKYGHFLLREMLICNIPSDVIISISKTIVAKELNPHALENTTEIALRLKKMDVALEFFKHLDPIRPHYFWPLFVEFGNRDGEVGVTNLLKTMVESYKTLPDYDTLEGYFLPFCNLDNLSILIQRLKNDYGLTVKELMTPLLSVLLQHGELNSVLETCELYNVQLDSDKLIKSVAQYWRTKGATYNTDFIASFLQVLSSRNGTTLNNDLVGIVVVRILRDCRNREDFEEFSKLLRNIKSKKLLLNTLHFDILSNLITTRVKSKDLRIQLKDDLEAVTDMSVWKNFQSHAQMPHPNQMTLDQLEFHLVELKNKQMHTRGVLRRLIQAHCSAGNAERLKELRDEFRALNFEETPGMKASLFHSAVQGKNVQIAGEMYRDLVASHPNFHLDEFKIVDYATLLVSSRMEERALSLLRSEVAKRQILGGPSISRNCVNLLNSYDDAGKQREMFDFLVKENFSKVSNVLFGPLVRLHLTRGDVRSAVNSFLEAAEKYRFTPLKLELVLAMVRNGDESLLEKVLSATRKVHGPTAASATLVVALCESGLDKPLKRFLLEVGQPQIHRSEFDKMMRHWVQEGELEPLFTLAKASRGILYNPIDRQGIHLSIMKIYEIKRDCEAAITFYEQLLENEESVSKDFEKELWDLLVKCKYEKIPKTLSSR